MDDYTIRSFLDHRVFVLGGENRTILPDLTENSFDSIVTDPPYAFQSIVKRFANSPRSAATENIGNPYGRTGRGFMGMRWDNGDVSFSAEFWAACLRALKPGGHLVSFGSPRGYHRMACAIEGAGFEIRDSLMWIYGQGFPKSHNMDGEWEGWGTALKPAFEPIVLARKPLSEGTVAANVMRWGTGAINIGACRVASNSGALRSGEDSQDRRYSTKGSTNFAALPGPRGGDPAGRWPANVVTDGSTEVWGAFPDSNGQQGDLKETGRSRPSKTCFGDMAPPRPHAARRDVGSAARFFYAAKANKADRAGSKHPTVKPVSLMRWLCRLVTPPGGIILDPFAGTGTTAAAAVAEGFKCHLVEKEPEYLQDIYRRLSVMEKEVLRRNDEILAM